VPGVDVHSLTPKAGEPAERTAQVKAVLTSIGAGVEHDQAPGLAMRLPAPVRERIAAAVKTATAFEWMGDETFGAYHFNADPRVTNVSWYRARTPEGFRYFTVRQTRERSIVGVIIED
jgi:hypothetical protein